MIARVGLYRRLRVRTSLTVLGSISSGLCCSWKRQTRRQHGTELGGVLE
jgi:hypothetical protein